MWARTPQPLPAHPGGHPGTALGQYYFGIQYVAAFSDRFIVKTYHYMSAFYPKASPIYSFLRNNCTAINKTDKPGNIPNPGIPFFSVGVGVGILSAVAVGSGIIPLPPFSPIVLPVTANGENPGVLASNCKPLASSGQLQTLVMY